MCQVFRNLAARRLSCGAAPRRRRLPIWSLFDAVRHYATAEERKILDEAAAAGVLDPSMFAGAVWPEYSPDPLQSLRSEAIRVLEAILLRMATGPQKFRATGRDQATRRRDDFEFEGLCGDAHNVNWPIGSLNLSTRNSPAFLEAIRIELIEAPAVEPPEPQRVRTPSLSAPAEAEPWHKPAGAPTEKGTGRQPHAAPASDPELQPSAPPEVQDDPRKLADEFAKAHPGRGQRWLFEEWKRDKERPEVPLKYFPKKPGSGRKPKLR
jgi:hypothetical protein